MKVSDNTAISMPMRNLLSILGAVAIGVWSYFGIVERLNNIETNGKLMIADVEKIPSLELNGLEVKWVAYQQTLNKICL